MKKEIIEKSYHLAKEQYAELGVDTDKVISEMDNINISLHCWQTDDVGGFEKPGSVLGGGGIQATGNFPGKAKTKTPLSCLPNQKGLPGLCCTL